MTTTNNALELAAVLEPFHNLLTDLEARVAAAGYDPLALLTVTEPVDIERLGYLSGLHTAARSLRTALETAQRPHNPATDD